MILPKHVQIDGMKKDQFQHLNILLQKRAEHGIEFIELNGVDDATETETLDIVCCACPKLQHLHIGGGLSGLWPLYDSLLILTVEMQMGRFLKPQIVWKFALFRPIFLTIIMFFRPLLENPTWC